MYKVIIVGAGGAGLMAARELGKKKIKTLVLDRNDDILKFQFNTLGSFIKLEDFGLTENVVARPIYKMTLSSRLFKRELITNINILDKRKLHEELISSLDKEYVTIQRGTNIKSFNTSELGYITSLVDQKGNEYSAEYFIDATGTAGFLSKKVGLQETKAPIASGVEYNVKYKGDVNEMHLLIGKMYEGGYGWIFPLQEDRAIIGFGTFDDIIVKEAKRRLDKIIQLPHIIKLVEKDNERAEGGSLPITKVINKFIHHNLICIGDSVSQVNPIVGEGYKFIFESAIMAVDALEKTIQNNDRSDLNEYEENWNKRFLDNYKFAKYGQGRILRYSKSDFLIDMGVLFLKTKSNDSVLKVIAGEYTRKSIVDKLD